MRLIALTYRASSHHPSHILRPHNAKRDPDSPAAGVMAKRHSLTLFRLRLFTPRPALLPGSVLSEN